MQINLITLDGSTIVYTVEPFDKVFEVKEKLRRYLGLPEWRGGLVHVGKVLIDHYTIEEYCVKDLDTMTMQRTNSGPRDWSRS
jgi:hypothetical protein